MNDLHYTLPDAGQSQGQSQAAPASSLRQGVLVLGMHRSGTSAMTGVLGKLGCALPADLMGPGIGNEKGHWEAEGPVAVDERILDSASSHWEDWDRFNPDWYASPLYASALEDARAALRNSFAQAPLFVLKDPRICRLVPFWLDVFKAEGIQPAIVLCLRQPAEVARSLVSRDGMDHAYAHLLWLRHMLEAEIATRGLKRVICHFDQLRDDWQDLTTRISLGLGIVWPRQSARAKRDIEDFLGPPTARPPAAPSSAPMPWIVSADAILNRWAKLGENPADYPELDRILGEFNAAATVFASLVLPGSKSLGAGGGQAMCDALSALEATSSDLMAQVDARDETILRLRGRLDEGDSQIAALKRELAQPSLSRDQNAQAVDELQARVEQANDVAQRNAEDVAQRDRLISGLNAEVDRLRHTMVENRLAHEANALQHTQTMAKLNRQLSLADEACRQRDQQIAQMSRERDEARMTAGQLGAIRSQLEKARAQLSQLAAEHRNAQLELARAQRAEHHLQGQLDARLADLTLLSQARASSDAHVIALEDRLRDAERLRDIASADRDRAEDAVSRAETRIAELGAIRAKTEEAYAREKAKRLVAERASETSLDDATARLQRQMQAVGRVGSLAGPNQDWIRQIMTFLLKRPLWWAIMPTMWRQRRERTALRQRGLFDAHAYLRQNPDVAARGSDPLRHYLSHGMAEGRKLPR